MISFETTREESDLLFAIAKRAKKLTPVQWKIPQKEWWMDITACHANGSPLQLERLLEAPDFDFVHDMFGIRRHINRRTAKLENCFVPRYAARERESA